MKLCLVVGARPNFMKIAPIVEAIDRYNGRRGGGIEYSIVHTGQHYDRGMSKLFFEDLGIPVPHVNLEVGSASHAVQTAEIMKRFEKVCLDGGPTHILVVGDVNSTIACALVASKLGIRVIHVEAGLRSFDRGMPEEINRVLTDSISDFLFTTEESANRNLKQEGIADEKVHFVGNVMIDTLLKHRKEAEKSRILEQLGLAKGRSGKTGPPVLPYAALTLHRPSNVDDKETFEGIIQALVEISERTPIVLPIHPRTLKRVEQFRFRGFFKWAGDAEDRRLGSAKGVFCIDPLGYLDFLKLMAHAKLVLTDSGGIQEETTILQVPCVTLRKNTERPVTVTQGTNVVAGVNKEDIVAAAASQLERFDAFRKGSGSVPPLWDGKAAERIVEVLAKDR